MKFTPETAITKGTWRRGVQHQRGEANNAAKLWGLDVERIRAGTDLTNTQWATWYGVSESTIRRIRNRQTWKHVA